MSYYDAVHFTAPAALSILVQEEPAGTSNWRILGFDT